MAVLSQAMDNMMNTESQDNLIGVIRPTLHGCDLFGLTQDSVLRPAAEFGSSVERYVYQDTGFCHPNMDASVDMDCDRVQVRHCLWVFRCLFWFDSRSLHLCFFYHACWF